MLKISMFGSLSVSLTTDAQAQELSLATRVAGLLAFLALGHGRYFTRTEIVRCFTTDRAEEMSVGSLNTTLWRLRKGIERHPAAHGEFIVCNPQGAIGLSTDGSIWLDVDEFAQLTHAGLSKPLHLISEMDVRNMRMAVELYKADVLTDFDDDWVLLERERLRRIYLNTLGRLLQSCAAMHDYEGAISYAQRILEVDALREDVHRELMRLHLLNGQRALALRQFEICRDRLRHELAIQPMRQTVQLYRQIAYSAIGNPPSHETTEAGSGLDIAALPPADPSPPAHPPCPADRPDTAEHPVISARRLIAEADLCLQRSLGLIKH